MYKVESSHTSGSIHQKPEGLTFWFRVVDENGNAHTVPSTGILWKVYRNGEELNFPQLSQLGNAAISQTNRTRELGFRLNPDVTGLFEVTGKGLGIDARWAFVVKANLDVEADRPVTLLDLKRFKADILEAISGLRQK